MLKVFLWPVISIILGTILLWSISSYFSEFKFPSIKNGPIIWSFNIPAQTFSFPKYCVLSSCFQWGFILSQYLQLCLFKVSLSSNVALSEKIMLKWKFGLLSIRAIISSQNSTRRSKSSSFNSCPSVTLNGWNLFFFNILWTDFIFMPCIEQLCKEYNEGLPRLIVKRTMISLRLWL